MQKKDFLISGAAAYTVENSSLRILDGGENYCESNGMYTNPMETAKLLKTTGNHKVG